MAADGQPAGSTRTSLGESLREAQRPTRSMATPKSVTRIGCWNVRTMYIAGKAAQVAREMDRYQLDVLVQDASTPSTTLRMRGVENDKGGGKEDGRIQVCVPQTNPRNSVATESEQREDRGYYRNK